MQHQLLAGKRGIIFGALNEQSIAWAVAKRCHEEGADLVLTNTPVALRLGTLQQLAAPIDATVIPADATNLSDLEQLFTQAQEVLGGKIDFVLHAVAMSLNIRRKRTYDNLDYNWFNQTLDISAVSFHKMLQTAYRMDAIAEYGSVVALSYIAAQRHVMGYNDMADAKALLESITRNFGAEYGRKRHVRINTISQSPTLTTAGSGIESFRYGFEIADKTSPLGNATAEDCANMCAVLFSDYTRKVTMQNIYHDGGFSAMGMQLLYGDKGE